MSVCSFPVLKGFEVETDCECTGSTTVRWFVGSFKRENRAYAATTAAAAVAAETLEKKGERIERTK